MHLEWNPYNARLSIRSWKVLFFYVLASLIFFNANGAQVARPLELKELSSLLIQNSPLLLASQEQLNIARLEHQNIFSRFLPSLDGELQTGWQGQQSPPVSTTRTGVLSLGLTENLYDNGKTFLQYRQSQIAEELSLLEVRIRREASCLDLAGAYFRYSLTVHLLDVQKRQLKLLEREFRIISEKYEQGLRTRQDYLRFKSQLQRSKLDYVQSENDRTLAKNEIARLTALKGDFEVAVDEKIINAAALPRELTKTADPVDFQLILAVKRLRIKDELSEYEVRRNRRDWLPRASLNLGATYSKDGILGADSTAATAQTTQWKALIKIEYNFWDWGIRRRNVEIAARQAERGHQEGLAEVLNDQNQAERTRLEVKSLMENYELSQEVVKADEQSFEMIQKEFEKGQISYLDVISSVKDLTASQATYFRNYFQLRTEMARGLSLVGTLYDHLQKN